MENPDFPISIDRAREILAEMEAHRCSPARPILVLAGWRAPSAQVRMLAARLRRWLDIPPGDILPVAYPLRGRIEEIAGGVIEQVHRHWAGRWGKREAVDVVAISMGGLVARFAADGSADIGTPAPHVPPHPRPKLVSAVVSPRATAVAPTGETHLPPPRPGEPGRLKIARLFTLASPHRGARLARFVAPDAAARAMRPGSAFLADLDRRLSLGHDRLIPYTRLNDWWVGATRTAPPGFVPIWAGGFSPMSHMTISYDPRILADLARRLRGQEPLARPGRPPPHD